MAYFVSRAVVRSVLSGEGALSGTCRDTSDKHRPDWCARPGCRNMHRTGGVEPCRQEDLSRKRLHPPRACSPAPISLADGAPPQAGFLNPRVPPGACGPPGPFFFRHRTAGTHKDGTNVWISSTFALILAVLPLPVPGERLARKPGRYGRQKDNKRIPVMRTET